MEQSDYSVALFQIKQPAAAGQEFIADFTRLAEISAYLQITNACDITLKITSGMATGEPQELYSEVFTVEPTEGGWVTFTPSEPVALSANQKYEFTLSSTDSVILFGKNGLTETEAAGCCALNGENGWVRFTDYQSAFRVVGSPPGEYEELIQSIDALPEMITDCRSASGRVAHGAVRRLVSGGSADGNQL